MTKDPGQTKSKEELERQGEILKEVRSVLIKNGLKPILSDGLVLGIVREGDFIKWDFDGDFFVNNEIAFGKEQSVLNDLLDKGFIKITVRPNIECWKVAVEKEDYHIDIRGFYRDKDTHICKVLRSNKKQFSIYSMPAEFMDNLQEVEFYGAKYLIPEDTEGYLTHLYGDWRTPIRSVQHNEYLTSRFKRVVQNVTR